MERYDQELKARVIKEIEETGQTATVARKHGIKETTVYSWVRSQKSGSQRAAKSSIQKLRKELEDANLENQILKELLKKTNQVWLRELK